MFNALFVTLRELAELLIIAQAATGYLRAAGRGDLARRIPRTMGMGVLAGVALSAWASVHPWDPRVSASISILFAVAVLFLTSGMLSSAQIIRSRMQLAVDAWMERHSAALWVGLFGAIVGLRETVELAFFLHQAHDQAGAQDTVLGFALGLVATGLLVAAYRPMRARVDMLSVFRLSTLLMALLSIQLVLRGCAELLTASVAEDSPLLHRLAPFLEGGAWYGWVCATLMVVPLVAMAREWWSESSAT